MNRFVSTIRTLLLALLLGLGAAGAAAAQTSTPARVLVNGKPLNFTATVPARNYNGTVLVPIGTLFPRLGFAPPALILGLNGAPDRVTAVKVLSGGGTVTITFLMNSATATITERGVARTVTVDPIAAPRYQFSADGRFKYAMVPLRWVSEAAKTTHEWDQDSQTAQIYYYDELDAGFYFYGKQPDGATDASGCQKFETGEDNPFFNPTKPTIIYVHGIQPAGVANKSREDLRLKAMANHATQNNWIDKGWNVAIYHWVQLADEGTEDTTPPFRVESKLYRTTPVSRTLPFPIQLYGTRWRKADNSFCAPAENLNRTVPELFVDQYMAIFGTNYGREIELVGNSMGGNLVMMAAQRMYERNYSPTLFPKRITLMDPYWTGNGNSMLPLLDTYGSNLDTKSLPGIIAQNIESRYQTPIMYYRTSPLGYAGTSTALAQQVGLVNLKPDYAAVSGDPIADATSRHTMPVRAYFNSINYYPGFSVRTTAPNGAAIGTPGSYGFRTTPSIIDNSFTISPNDIFMGGANMSSAAIRHNMLAQRLLLATPGRGNLMWSQSNSASYSFFYFATMRFTATEVFSFSRAAATSTQGSAASITEVSVGPNPVQGALSIRYTLPETATTHVQVSDLLGRVLATVAAQGPEAAGPHELRADLSALPAGPYVLAFFQDGQKVRSEKIMKTE